MYSPAHFQIPDRNTLVAFMREHSFATLVTIADHTPFASHLPFLVHDTKGAHGTLATHLARANPQWRHFESGREVLVTFTGPHSYISPAWYATSPAVPTWNYTAVHVYGKPQLVTDPVLFEEMLRELIEVHENSRPGRWSGEMPRDFFENLMRGIVGVEIEITRIEGKFKLSQNRPADSAGIIEALRASPSENDRSLAALMAAFPPIQSTSPV